MTTRTVTFEVDTVALFDMLHKTGGDMSAIGERVVGNLLADTGIIDAIGMAVYGIYTTATASTPLADLLDAAKEFIPGGIAIGNGNVPDSLTIPLDTTMGELRKLEAAIKKAEAPGVVPLYLIWSNEHRAWWAPNRQGYCQSIELAGRYSRSEAMEIVGSPWGWEKGCNPDEIAIPEPDALQQSMAPQVPA